MFKKPSNAIDIGKDDTGKKVIVNSISGAIHNTTGTVLYGPYQFTYNAQTTQNNKMITKKFITTPYWCVKLKGYNLDIHFTEPELTFI